MKFYLEIVNFSTLIQQIIVAVNTNGLKCISTLRWRFVAATRDERARLTIDGIGRARPTRSFSREKQRRFGRVKRTLAALRFSFHCIQVAASPIYPSYCLTRIQATIATSAAVGIYYRRFSGWWKIVLHVLEE